MVEGVTPRTPSKIVHCESLRNGIAKDYLLGLGRRKLTTRHRKLFDTF